MEKEFVNYYLDPITKDYFNFDGKTTRKEFWMYMLLNIIVSFIVGVVGGLIHLPMISMLYSLAVFIPGIAITIRRLHDIGKSGWWILISLIPFIGIIWLIVLLVLDSKKDDKTKESDKEKSIEK